MTLITEPASLSWRPTITGNHYAASCGHFLATAAAMRVLDAGGNAVDAGVTAAIAMSVLQPDVVSFAGVAPMLVYLASERRVVSFEGLGYWPALTDVARMREVSASNVPEGIWRQIVPAAPATHVRALQEFGTISFEQAATPAMELARDGFALYPELRDGLELHGAEIDRYAANAAIFRPGGATPPLGARLTQPALATTIGAMIGAERAAPGDRRAKLSAVHDYFYRGPVAKQIADFHRQEGGFLREEDLASFEVPVTAGIQRSFHGYDVHSCDVWCQGVVMLEALGILQDDDLVALGHNSSAYLHLLAEALNLAFADREHRIGDPKFVDVPTPTLLSSQYAKSQRARIDAARAFGEMPAPGRIDAHDPHLPFAGRPSTGAVAPSPDTIYACVVDRHGNACSVTPSDTMYDSPVIPSLGFAPSSRGNQSRLETSHPSSVVPGKRPRLTPTPALALRDGRFAMAWGTPGGDVQCASMLQVFLNHNVFGMPMQQAIEAPRIATFSFPNSFAPNTYLPGRLCVEDRINTATIDALAAIGHDIQRWSGRSWSAGAVCAIARDTHTGMLHAGADPRRAAYAMAW